MCLCILPHNLSSLFCPIPVSHTHRPPHTEFLSFFYALIMQQNRRGDEEDESSSSAPSNNYISSNQRSVQRKGEGGGGAKLNPPPPNVLQQLPALVPDDEDERSAEAALRQFRGKNCLSFCNFSSIKMVCKFLFSSNKPENELLLPVI